MQKLGLIVLLLGAGSAAAQTQPKEYPQNYREPFKGKPQKADDFRLLGEDAASCVKFEPEGLRITLPPGKERPPTGVATGFGVAGDFEITVGYEVLSEPKLADAGQGVGTRISLALNVNKPGVNEAAIRRKVSTTREPHVLIWRRLTKDLDSPPEDVGRMFPVKAKSGRFRLVRTGDQLSYYLSEEAAGEFTLLHTTPFVDDEITNIQVFAATGSDSASLDARFTELQIRAVTLPQKPLPKTEPVSEPSIPTKEYAQTYEQSFKSAARPDGWNFTSRVSEQLVQFEPAGLRITMPVEDSAKGRSVGIVTGFGVKGDYEITMSFEVLKEPDPKNAGKGGTRLSLVTSLDTPLLDTSKAEAASFSRSVGSRAFVVWVRNRDRAAPLSYSFENSAPRGRLRLVRSGDELYYLAAAGSDQPFRFLKKYPFGKEDLKRIAIVCSTGGDKASLDVRVTDLRIRADAIPGAPTAPVTAPTAESKGGPGSDPQASRGGALVRILIVAAILGVVMLAFLLRKRGAMRPPAESGGAVAFPCPTCSKALTTKANLAGKKIKCPKCGATVLVPSAENNEP